MFVCVYIRTYIHIYIYKHTYIHTYTHTYIIYVCMYVCMYVCKCIYVCVCNYIYACIEVFIHIDRYMYTEIAQITEIPLVLSLISQKPFSLHYFFKMSMSTNYMISSFQFCPQLSVHYSNLWATLKLYPCIHIYITQKHTNRYIAKSIIYTYKRHVYAYLHTCPKYMYIPNRKNTCIYQNTCR